MWWLVNILILVSLGQYVHLPSLVQTLGFSVTELGSDGGKDILLDVRMSLKFGSLLKPIFCGTIFLSSSQCSIRFQFFQIKFLIIGF